jgi:hypothetical protein
MELGAITMRTPVTRRMTPAVTSKHGCIRLQSRCAFHLGRHVARQMSSRRSTFLPVRALESEEDDGGDASDDWEGFDTSLTPAEASVQEEAAADELVSHAAAEAADAIDVEPAAVSEQAASMPYHSVPSSPSHYIEPEPDMSIVWKTGIGGIVALVGLAGLGFLGHKTWKSQAPKVQKAMEARQLAKESQQRLGEFMAQLRNQATADLSAKNLGDEGEPFGFMALFVLFYNRLG